MFEKIKNLFRKKAVQLPPSNTEPFLSEQPKKVQLFQCHYCYHSFEVTAKMQFPTSVPSVGKEYIFQGIGVQCPKCLQTCIYG